MRATDRANQGPRPKASNLSSGNEIFLAYRFVADHFEGRINGRVIAQRTISGKVHDSNIFIGTFEFGPRWGYTSMLVIWEPTSVVNAYTKRQMILQNDVGFRLKHAVSVPFLSENLIPISLRVSFAKDHPDGFSRMRIVADAEWSVRLSARDVITWAPEIGFAHYDDFFGRHRADLIPALRVTPRHDFGNGLSFAVSINATAAASSHSQKSGADFEIRPEIKWHM